MTLAEYLQLSRAAEQVANLTPEPPERARFRQLPKPRRLCSTCGTKQARPGRITCAACLSRAEREAAPRRLCSECGKPLGPKWRGERCRGCSW